VLGTLLWEAAQTNPAWEALLRQLPRQKGDTVQLAQPVDVRALLGMTDLSAEHPFLYDGSLTTPPCSEGIAWIVRSKGIYLSRAQLDMLRRAMPDDARPIQHRNGRPIIHRTR
jgi:carbonic anhydrase